jgi:hypothetical protein
MPAAAAAEVAALETGIRNGFVHDSGPALRNIKLTMGAALLTGGKRRRPHSNCWVSPNASAADWSLALKSTCAPCKVAMWRRPKRKKVNHPRTTLRSNSQWAKRQRKRHRLRRQFSAMFGVRVSPTEVA